MGDDRLKRPRPGSRADSGDQDPSAPDGDDSRHRRRLRVSVPSELSPTTHPPENTPSAAALRAAMTKRCPPDPPLHLDRLASLLPECADLDIDLFSFPACPLLTGRKSIDPLFLDDLVQATSGRPVSVSVILCLRAVFDAAVKASAVPLPSPASAAGHAPVALATAAAPSSGGAITPSTVSVPADGRPTAGTAAQRSSGDASGCGASATHSSSSSEGEDEESTVDENGSPVVRFTCKTRERPCAVALVLIESHKPTITGAHKLWMTLCVYVTFILDLGTWRLEPGRGQT